MSKTFLFALILLGIFLLSGCREESNDDFLSEFVEQYDAGPFGPVENIWKYRFNSETVYYIPPKCCDIPSVLLNEKGEVLCSPDGGLTGSGDGRCPDFFQKRNNGKLVWSAEREDSAR